MLPVLVGFLVLAGCQTTKDAPSQTPTLTSEQVAEAKAKWTGKWSGAWGADGNCGSSIEVQEVTGTSAVATYSWRGGCGATPGSRTDDDATVSGNQLELRLPFGWGVRYTLRDDGDLDGEWWSRGRKRTASATFYRE